MLPHCPAGTLRLAGPEVCLCHSESQSQSQGGTQGRGDSGWCPAQYQADMRALKERLKEVKGPSPTFSKPHSS